MRYHDEIRPQNEPRLAVSVEPVAKPVLFLLLARHVLRLDEPAELPALDPVPDIGRSAIPEDHSADQFSANWAAEWSSTISALENANDESESVRWQQIRQSWPSWLDERAFDAWMDALATREKSLLARSPEQAIISDLSPAARKGLAHVIVLPLRMAYSRRVSQRLLLVSHRTREDPALYALAVSARP